MSELQNLSRSSAELIQKAAAQRALGRQVVVIQGLGFVGAAVAAVVAGARGLSDEPIYYVIGIDIPTPQGKHKIDSINHGINPIASPDHELSRLLYEAVHVTANLDATAEGTAYTLADVIIVDIPLDVKNRVVENAPAIDIELENFKKAIHTIGRQMQPDALVLIETTIPFGVCEKIVMPILLEERGHRHITSQLYLAHAYERVMPGPRYVESIRNIWRTFAGIDRASADRARAFLESFTNVHNYPLFELEDVNASELAKLLENSYRAANIAFIYEWTLLAEATGINLFEVIEAIRVRRGTHDNIRFPGFGVGGYCLTKDSLLAQWSANNLFASQVTLNMTLEALRINYRMPLHTIDLLLELAGGDLTDKSILVCGVSYLPDISDTRNSPTELFIKELARLKANIIIHDPCVENWTEMPNIKVHHELEPPLAQADGVVFAVNHRLYQDLAPKTIIEHIAKPPIIIDAQNILTDEKAAVLHAAGCRLAGVGKGHWRKRGFQWQQ